jgi:molecular chaperone DnaK
LAGLEKVKLLREPEAAALAYGLTQEQRKIVLVFDLGGGTFDVSVLEVGGGFVEVIATSGDAHLGGDDWDRAIVDHVVQEMSVAAGLSATDVKALQADPIVSARLLEAAEQAKIALSAAKETRVQIPLLFRGLSVDVPLSRGRFESLTKSLLARLLLPLREVAIMSGVNLPGESGQLGINEGAFADDEDEDDEDDERGAGAPALTPAQLRQTQLKGKAAAKERKKVRGSTARELRRLQKALGDPSLAIFPGGQLLDDVVLVGGSTRIPAVLRLVRTITGVDPRRTVNPDEAVSLGAAVMAGILDGSVKNM